MRTHAPALARPWWLLPVGRLDWRWWIPVGAALVGVEYFAGPDTRYPMLYTLPVVLAAWYSGRRPALALAFAVPAAGLIFDLASRPQLETMGVYLATRTLRGGVIAIIALWFARLSEHERALRHHVESLEGLLPICSFCKSIRNNAGNWEPLEEFVSTRSEAQFSHGFCPPCGKTHYDFELDA